MTGSTSDLTTDDYAYFDYAATAPLCDEAACAMAAYQVPGRANLIVGANANSLHSPGRAAFEAMERARKSVAADIGARRPDEVVFTSGATEADVAALVGIAHGAAHARHIDPARGEAPHIVTTAIEHDAVLQPAKRLETQGFRVTYVRPDRQGFVSAQAVRDAVGPQTVLVSVQAANSELGSVQPLCDIARAAHDGGALFHTDAVQAVGKLPLSMQDIGADAASFSAHKVGGPKGVGALYLKTRTPFEAQLLGGGQESARRSGTQNVAGIVGFAAALRASVNMQVSESARLCALRDRLYAELAAMDGVMPTVEVPLQSERFLPNIVHVLVRGMESETLILRLDALGFGVSGGSACSSHSLAPSHVLTSCGVSADAAQGALRISLGRYTTERDVEALIAALPRVIR
ncbi:cysteine desulfurase family protein [Adlercreutzia sp. ZJ141]|uniref:cysteine desulfurase family protein n=1 Tax=Adlercreutzia sp. ZJ141 TaxID=2709406 RepID=UPI0013EDFB39|nr:cysteine desulfurase family protein [Adlercreutzia sp. ZJ141]